MPFVRSMIWSGTTKSRGLICSCRLPTALKAMIVRTPIVRSAAMFARFGTSCGASSWCRPWRERKAIGIGLPVVGDGCWSTAIGDEGVPHGVVGLRLATCVKSARELRPVPPITPIVMGSGGSV